MPCPYSTNTCVKQQLYHDLPYRSGALLRIVPLGDKALGLRRFSKGELKDIELAQYYKERSLLDNSPSQ